MIKEHTGHLKYDQKITSNLIKKRCTRRTLTNIRFSLLHEMEIQLATILLASDHSRHPQPTSMVIELANELISGTDMEKGLIN